MELSLIGGWWGKGSGWALFNKQEEQDAEFFMGQKYVMRLQSDSKWTNP